MQLEIRGLADTVVVKQQESSWLVLQTGEPFGEYSRLESAIQGVLAHYTTPQSKMQLTLFVKSEAEVSDEILVAVEFGYRQCEKGSNLETALKTARELLRG